MRRFRGRSNAPSRIQLRRSGEIGVEKLDAPLLLVCTGICVLDLATVRLVDHASAHPGPRLHRSARLSVVEYAESRQGARRFFGIHRHTEVVLGSLTLYE